MSTETASADISGVWDVYFGRPTPPEGEVIWEAYSHEELHRMLWQDADITDVSTIAADWSAHRAALVNHAEVLREQRAALLDSWRGSSAEEAAQRLLVLADRVEKIADLAYAGERAAEQAADALAWARAMMPAPPGDPAAPMTDMSANWTFGGAGFSFYADTNASDLQKQRAVQAMRTYESSLTDSSRLIGQAQGAIPAASTMPGGGDTTANGSASPSDGTSASGSSWRRLTGTGGLVQGAMAGASTGAGVAAGTVAGSPAGFVSPLANGARVGAAALPGGLGATAAQAAAESAATRAGSVGHLAPPGSGTRGRSAEEDHTNQLPTIDHALFPLAEPASEAVIGLPLREWR
ncbi:hypothetical protein [Amycolatopsis decaplanina]|uniref:PPE family domain-containing protein n=1 Tax=Amycolatopsis decaplanina DSM 44594 TaxID=1284240 RepID=M2ZTQ7_9PSEU|nr:hypothetical protein [Amycolatopsis decaplanina]EME63734.1 hypothetical protein H074_03934 [Amycolatopsis decaplanina DSM 44594]